MSNFTSNPSIYVYDDSSQSIRYHTIQYNDPVHELQRKHDDMAKIVISVLPQVEWINMRERFPDENMKIEICTTIGSEPAKDDWAESTCIYDVIIDEYNSPILYRAGLPVKTVSDYVTHFSGYDIYWRKWYPPGQEMKVIDGK